MSEKFNAQGSVTGRFQSATPNITEVEREPMVGDEKPEAQKVKRMENPGQFLIDSGLLFQINRDILHPLGLALEVVFEGDTSRIGGIWDYRDDPEGMLYDDQTVLLGQHKLNEFMKSVTYVKYVERYKRLGFVAQYPPKDSEEFQMFCKILDSIRNEIEWHEHMQTKRAKEGGEPTND